MTLWPALLITPLLALGAQSLAYALTPVMCAQQAHAWLTAITAACVLLSALLTLLAARSLRHAGHRQHFVARIATGVGALFTLVLLAFFLPIWILHPCQW